MGNIHHQFLIDTKALWEIYISSSWLIAMLYGIYISSSWLIAMLYRKYISPFLG